MLTRALKFGAVGIIATLVHMSAGYAMIQAQMSPYLANFFAFLIAFIVSFFGHLGFSFADMNADPRTAFRRFGIVAIAGFLCNEALLTLMLTFTTIKEAYALLVSTGCVAVLTFILSKAWAFRSPRNP